MAAFLVPHDRENSIMAPEKALLNTAANSRTGQTRQAIVHVQTVVDCGGCVIWTEVNLLVNFRVQAQMKGILCSTACFYLSWIKVWHVLSCSQVRALVRATVTRITEAAPRSVRWSEDWSNAPVTLDID